jgi:signal transduction histidine kinase/PAS domain-containing protein
MLGDQALFINLPGETILWVVWSIIFISQFALSLITNKPKPGSVRANLIWLAVLSAMILFTPILGGMNLTNYKFIPGILNAESGSNSVMLFIAVPWMLAAIFVNTFPAFSLAIASGFLLSTILTHNFSTPLYFGGAILIFSGLIKKDISIKNDWLSNSPLVKALLTIAILSPLAFLLFMFEQSGGILERFEYAKSGFTEVFLSLTISIFIGGIFCQVAISLFRKNWLVKKSNFLKPSLVYRKWLYGNASFGLIFLVIFFLWKFLLDQAVDQRAIVYLLIFSLILIFLSIFIWFNVVKTQVDVDNVLSQMQKMLKGDYYDVYEPGKNTKKRSELIEKFETLKRDIRINKSLKERLISLDPGISNSMTLEDVLSGILRSAYDEKTSSVRIILFVSRQENRANDRFLRMGLGTENKLYAYLDELIIEQLGKESRLVLNEIKVDQLFNLKPGMPFPDSIIAIRLMKGEEYLGVLWIGFSQVKWFDQEDLAFYDILGERASNLIQNAQLTKNAVSTYRRYQRLLDAIPEPIYVTDGKGNLRFSNLESTSEKGIRLDNFQEISLGLSDIISDARENPFSKEVNLQNGQSYKAKICKFNFDEHTTDFLITLEENTKPKSANLGKDEFVTTVSHGLRMPLNRMKGYVSLLQNIGSLSDQQETYLQRTFSEMDGMQKLIDNILNLERLDSNDPIRPTFFKLKELVGYVIGTVESQAVKKKIKLNLFYGFTDDIEVQADLTLLQQALINILDNAIKFSNMDGIVDVQVDKLDDKIQFSFRDYGPGIAPLDLPRVFDRYFHVEHGASGQTRGIGLGLAIVRTIAEKHNGKVWVNSQLGRGSTFYFEIPISHDP